MTVPETEDDLSPECPYCGKGLAHVVLVPEGETWLICTTCRGYCERDGEAFPMRDRPAGEVECLHDDALELLARMWAMFDDFIAFALREAPELAAKPGFSELEEVIRQAREQAARPDAARRAELARRLS